MKTAFRTVLIIIGLLALNYACDPIESYPETPKIKFKSISIEDSIDYENPNNSKRKLKVTISVIDGDGDLGILNGNNVYPGFEEFNNRDLFFTKWLKIDNEYIADTTKYHYGMPYLEPEGQDKSIVADVEISMDIYYPHYFVCDTFKYSFYILDRAKHESNIAETPEIPIDTLGLIE